MRLELFHFDLPTELIAQEPAACRTDARLLCLNGASGAIVDAQFTDLIDQLEPGDLLVFNETRVIPARLFGRKASGGRVEILLERIVDDDTCVVAIKASKSPKIGSQVHVGADFVFEVLGRDRNLYVLRAPAGGISELFEEHGHMPLPPYIDRADTAQDAERYQTVYGKVPGAVAAPTAGLHFDEAYLARLEAHGINRAHVTLHVGAGTFQPVRSDDIEAHQIHEEYFEVSESVVEQVRQTRHAGKRVVAVGTTSVRALESAAGGGALEAARGDTNIFIYPGYQFQVVDALLTNFHLPQSTLIMLVSAFAGRENVLRAYQHAVAERYRFFSYGDAMWLTRAPGA